MSETIFQYIPCYGLSQLPEEVKEAVSQFQYIPCYGLSIMAKNFGNAGSNFNTSHVTVYHASKTRIIEIYKFQYIPCYGLSFLQICYICLLLLFQYIPCYGLSANIGEIREREKNFNTSHVTVYRIFTNQTGTLSGNFNTSHVTVYLRLLI